MAELKTKRNTASVDEFIAAVPDEQKRADSKTLVSIMSEVSGCEAEMWGGSIIGFGRYNYKYKSGREGEWMLCGFSPRKQTMTVYVMGSSKEIEEMITRVGKHKRSKGCLYFKKLEDLDVEVLKKVIQASIDRIKSNNVML